MSVYLNDNGIGARLAALRKEKKVLRNGKIETGMTQKEVAEELGDTERYEHFENTEHPLTKEMRDTLRTIEEYILNTDIGIAVLADDVCVYIAKTDPFSLEDWGEALIQKCCKYMRRDVVRDVSVDFDDAVQMMTLDNRYAYVMRKSEKQKGLDPAPMVDGWDTIERACAAGIVYGFALGKDFLRICETRKNKVKSKAEKKQKNTRRRVCRTHKSKKTERE